MASKKLRVGIIGAGEVAQVIHLPTLQLLNHLFEISALCDLSQKQLDFCNARHRIPKVGTDAHAILNDPDIDVIFNLTSDEYHETYTIAALKAGKNVLLEKPLTLSVPSAKRILQAEKEEAQNGARIFVGTMRRYAPSFTNAFKRECASIPRILYARSRGIIGPNSFFVGQSGTSPEKYTDFPPEAQDQKKKLLDGLLQEAFPGKEITKARYDFCRFLGSLGSHDLSLLRETLGSPEAVTAVVANEPFYTALMTYKQNPQQKGDDHDDVPFACVYETGIDAVPRFDSSLTVYGKDKQVSIHYDTPFVKGLAIKVRVEETNEHGEVVTREILSSYEDAYTAELKELHECFTQGKPIKTSAEDACKDLELFQMIYERWEKQQEQQ